MPLATLLVKIFEQLGAPIAATDSSGGAERLGDSSKSCEAPRRDGCPGDEPCRYSSPGCCQ